MNVGDWNKGTATPTSRPGGTEATASSLWRGNGTGSFRAQVLLGTGFAKFRRIAPVGDVTADGHPGLVGKEPGGMMTYLPGQREAGLKSPVRAPARGSGRSTRSAPASGTRRGRPTRC